MINRRHLLTTGLLALTAGSLSALPSSVLAQSPRIEVVTSFTILADLVRQVGGERVNVRSLVPMGGDAHTFEPAPSHVALIRKAQLVVINGLGFEGWADRLIKAAQYNGAKLAASKGVKALSVRGSVDPHAWQDVANIKIYVVNIRDSLSSVDPAGAAAYASRAQDYLIQLDALDAEIRALLAPFSKPERKVITSHDAFTYYGDAYDVVFLAPQGMSTEAEPTARQIGALINQIKADNIRALFVENMNNPKLINQIAKETGVKPGGTLYADALGGAADSYIAMMRLNTTALAKALQR
jgi:zinc/manganese transport system substrate-binding protein